MKHTLPFTLYRFSGNHYEIGLQHGQTFREELQHIEEKILGKMVKSRALRSFILAYLGRKMFPYLPGEYVQEMKGIAEAGGISFETVYFLNLLPDLASYGNGLPGICFLNPLLAVCSCSILALSGERTGKGGILIGRNLDFGFADLIQDFIRFAVYQPRGRYAFFTITFPGFIGALTAYSERGIFFCESSIARSRMNRKAVPLVILFRQALEKADSLQEFHNQLIQAGRSGEANVLLAHQEKAVHLELALRDYRVIQLENAGILYAANHFPSIDLWRAWWKMRARNPFIDFRQGIMEEYLAGTPHNQGIEEVLQVMKRLGKGGGNISQTIYSLVFELASLTGMVAYQGGVPATRQAYSPFSLSGIFS